MVRRTLALLVALFAVAALGTTPAHAGGPTSVLLSAPPHVVAFGYEDRLYGELQQLTEIAGTHDTGGDHAVGNFIRATWLIHDMSVWRIDIIYPDAPGGPWIATTESLTTGKMPEQPTWHAAADRVGLLKLLGTLKLLHGQGGPTTLDWGYNASEEPPPTAEPTTEPAPSTAQAQVDSTGFFTGWRWIIPGVLLGALATVLAVRLLPKRRDWQLVDVE